MCARLYVRVCKHACMYACTYVYMYICKKFVDKGESSWMWVKARDSRFRRKKIHKVGGVYVCICLSSMCALVCIQFNLFMHICMFVFVWMM